MNIKNPIKNMNKKSLTIEGIKEILFKKENKINNKCRSCALIDIIESKHLQRNSKNANDLNKDAAGNNNKSQSSKIFNIIIIIESKLEEKEKINKTRNFKLFCNDSYTFTTKPNNKNFKKKIIKPNYTSKHKISLQMIDLQNTIHNKRKEIVNKTANNSFLQHNLFINQSKLDDHQQSQISHLDDLKETKHLIENLDKHQNYHKNLRLNILQANNINNIFVNYRNCETLNNLRDLSISHSKEKIRTPTIDTKETKDKNGLKLKKNFFDKDKLKNNLKTIPITSKKAIMKNIKVNLLKEKMQKLIQFKKSNQVINNLNGNNKIKFLKEDKSTLDDNKFDKNSKERVKKYLKENNIYQTINKNDNLNYFKPSHAKSKSPNHSDKHDLYEKQDKRKFFTK